MQQSNSETWAWEWRPHAGTLKHGSGGGRGPPEKKSRSQCART
jgi:hypothetical protein